MNAEIQKTHFTLEGTFNFHSVPRATDAVDVIVANANSLTYMGRKGTKVTVQGSEDNIKAWLSELKKRHVVSGLVYAGLHAELTQAKPAADPVGS